MSTQEHEEPRIEPATVPASTAPQGPATVGDSAPHEGGAHRDRERSDTFPVPTGPHTTGFGGHLLGIVVGLVATLLAIFLIVLGQSRILAGGLGKDTVSPDALGIILVTLGALVAACVVLFGLWTPMAPFTGGLVAVVIGAAYLFAPVEAHRQTVNILATEQNRASVLNSISVGTTGGLFVLGIMLLAAAMAFSIVKRRGLALGAFRERSRAS
ncbi:hypothetical protein [Pengzhenrongella sp.]|jgi:hypothetical protein|uniref:hypothetical protein n=1 Tax=Pengzhenrongella sp. TaxID=2888820 RepID=UPI002F95CD37